MSIDNRGRPLLGHTRKKYQCLLTGRDGRMMRDFICASAVPRALSPPLLRSIPSPPPRNRITQHLHHHHLHQCDRPVQYSCRHRCCHLSCHPIASTGTTVEICSAPTAREISTDSARSQGTLRTISPVQGRHRCAAAGRDGQVASDTTEKKRSSEKESTTVSTCALTAWLRAGAKEGNVTNRRDVVQRRRAMTMTMATRERHLVKLVQRTPTR